MFGHLPKFIHWNKFHTDICRLFFKFLGYFVAPPPLEELNAILKRKKSLLIKKFFFIYFFKFKI